MDYIFYYHGDIPKYFFHSIESIKKVDGDSKIYLCTNTNTKINNVETINKHSAKSTLTKEIETKFKKEDDSLWMSSMLRIFYNLNVAKPFDKKSYFGVRGSEAKK